MNLSTSIGGEQVLPLITVSLMSTKKLNLYLTCMEDFLLFTCTFLSPSFTSFPLLSLSILSHSLLIYLFFYYPFTQKIFLPSFLSLFHQSNPFLFQAFFLITGKIISPVNIRRTILSNYNFHLFTSSDYLPI